MPKILLVEDDQNLSEIYNARLSAEGYEVVSAANGEDALAVASQEKPDLVISDVMMPRVSGFEMLDILKHTDGMQGVKIIMLTALGQDNDRSKANELGADRYLVKSQVTLEDIVTAAKELLGDTGEAEPDLNLQASQAGPSAFDSSSSQPVSNQPTDGAVSDPQPTPNPGAPINDTQLAPAAAPQTPFQASTPSAVEPPAAPVAAPQTDIPAPASPTTPAPQPANPIAEPVAQPQPEQTPSYQATDSGTPDQISENTPQPATNESLAEAEPIEQEEAELSAQLNNASAVEDLGDSTQPVSSAPASAPEQIVSTDSPSGAQPVEGPAPQANEVESTDSQNQAPVAPMPEVVNPQPADPVPTPAAEPANAPEQPTETTQPPASPDHDELLASALKELQSNDPNQPTSVPQPTSITDSPAPVAPVGDEQRTERKVISPPDQSAARPDINDLLSKEESQQTGATAAPATPPSQVISPNSGSEPQNFGGVDPSSISL